MCDSSGLCFSEQLTVTALRSEKLVLFSAQSSACWALSDLDRIQIIKGWLDTEGKTHEKVYDVVWAGSELRKKLVNGELRPIGSTVDVKNATWTNKIGATELITVWKDPDFDASLRAFYYARVIEIPTPRWTAYDAKYYGIKMPKEVPMTLQVRAYTSPIWYTP